MNDWINWPDAPGFWWLREPGKFDSVCEVFRGNNRFHVVLRGVAMYPGYVTFRKVQPPDTDSPAWHDRPTCAGDWLCSLSVDGKIRPNVVTLDVDDIAAGAPYYTPRVFGPIPKDAP